MTTHSSPQPGILAPGAPFAESLTFALNPRGNPAEALTRLAHGLDPVTAVVGIGLPLADHLGARIPDLTAFPALDGTAVAIPATQQALWVLVRGDDRSQVFDRSRQIRALLGDGFLLDNGRETFCYAGGRDLTGYEDGTENPDEVTSPSVALVADGPFAASSYAAVQRWVHDLDGFNARPKAERDNLIGRERESNDELTDAPESSHVKRTAQESFEPPAFMVRRSMPFADANEHGLEFIAYGHSFAAFAAALRRMAGLDDGIVDALFEFSCPVTGGYYWCPPLKAGRLDLTALVSAGLSR